MCLRASGYFRGQDVSNKPEIVVPVYERTVPAEESTAPPTPAKMRSIVPSQLSNLQNFAEARFKLPQLSVRYHARLSLLLVSSVACLLYVSYISFPALPPLSSRTAFSH